MNITTGRQRAFLRGLAILGSFFALTSFAGLAQSFRGSIRGHVVDPSGSVIVGATVNAKNIGTGLVRETLTGDDGGYVLAELPTGIYTVTASSPGLSPVAQNVS